MAIFNSYVSLPERVDEGKTVQNSSTGKRIRRENNRFCGSGGSKSHDQNYKIMGCVWKFEGYSESSLSPFSIGHLGVHPPMVPNPSGWTVGPLLAVQNHEGTMISRQISYCGWLRNPAVDRWFLPILLGAFYHPFAVFRNHRAIGVVHWCRFTMFDPYFQPVPLGEALPQLHLWRAFATQEWLGAGDVPWRNIVL